MDATLQTQRLLLRRFTVDDAEFILTLLNEPSFLRYIGDKKVRNLDDARQYILNGPVASYEQNGFGLCLVELRESHTPIGMCGLLKRAELSDPDIGFALLPDFWNKGFAFEAATAVTNEMALGSVSSNSENHTRQSECADCLNEKNCPIRTLDSLSCPSFGVKDLRLKQPLRCYRTRAKD